MSQNSPFSVDEYQMSISSPFSVDEYQISTGALSPQSLHTMELSHEFSIDEYHYVEASMNVGSDMDATMSAAGDGQIDIQEELHEIISASPMHFRRVPRQNSRDRFSLVTSENQIKIDVGKYCCAHGCMSAIGKDKLRSIRCYYFSLVGNEKICSNIKISKFEYYLSIGRQCC